MLSIRIVIVLLCVQMILLTADARGINAEIAGYLKIKPLAQMRDGVLGIDNNLRVEKGQNFSQEVFDNLWKFSGLKWIRVSPVGWTEEEGVYNWTKADAFYDDLLDNGWQPFVLLHPTTPKYRPPCEPKYWGEEGNLVVYVDENTPLMKRGGRGEEFGERGGGRKEFRKRGGRRKELGERGGRGKEFGKRDCTEEDRKIAIKRWKTYEAFIEAFAQRYKDKITHYELFNEPDISGLYWPFKKTIPEQSWEEEYGYTARGLAQAVKRGNPNAKIMIGSLSGGGGLRALNKLQKAVAIVGPQNYDIFSWHPYRACHGCGSLFAVTPEAANSGAENPANFPWKIVEEELQAVYKVASLDGAKSNVEIWDTESGFVYYPKCPKGPFTPELFNQAKWFTRHFMVLFGTNPYIKKWFIFWGGPENILANECPKDFRSILNAGHPPTKRLAYYTASYLGSIFETGDLTPAGLNIQFKNTNAPGFRKSPRAVSLKKDGQDIFIGYWIPEDMDDKFKTPGKTDLVVNKVFSKPVLIYLADDPSIPPGQPNSKWGAVIPITDFSSSGNTTLFKNLPVTDYAYFIVEETAVDFGK